MLRSTCLTFASILLLTAACSDRGGTPEAQEAQQAFLQAGETAPDFTLRGSSIDAEPDKREFSLYKALDKGPVLLAFYPMAFTGG